MSFVYVLAQLVILVFMFVALVYVFNNTVAFKAGHITNSIGERVFYLVVFLILLLLFVGSVYLRMKWRF